LLKLFAPTTQNPSGLVKLSIIIKSCLIMSYLPFLRYHRSIHWSDTGWVWILVSEFWLPDKALLSKLNLLLLCFFGLQRKSWLPGSKVGRRSEYNVEKKKLVNEIKFSKICKRTVLKTTMTIISVKSTHNIESMKMSNEK
jgi:hypothetical protein